MNDEVDAAVTDDAADASARTGRLLSVVCHDLRSPLSAIVMGADFLRRSLAKQEGMESEKRVLEGLVRSAKRLDALIGHLHDVGRIDAGRFAVEKKKEDVGSMVTAAVAACKVLSGAKGVTVEPSTFPATELACDRAQLLKALAALLENAIRYSPANGTVRVAFEAAGGRATFAVSDDGAGMSPECLTHAFDHAWHASQSPRDGTGLGLALVRGIAVAHGGEAGVESRPGAGTRCSFWLPVAAT